ncbi:hypothetical protein BA6E_10594 [Bacteroidales bacterium 6E]|nr:hypothetical protein BA6E_10594 [Bacteroidales bacterium 6E]
MLKRILLSNTILNCCSLIISSKVMAERGLYCPKLFMLLILKSPVFGNFYNNVRLKEIY